MPDAGGTVWATRFAAASHQASLLTAVVRHPATAAEIATVQRLLHEATARLDQPLTPEVVANLEVAWRLAQQRLSAVQRMIDKDGPNTALPG